MHYGPKWMCAVYAVIDYYEPLLFNWHWYAAVTTLQVLFMSVPLIVARLQGYRLGWRSAGAVFRLHNLRGTHHDSLAPTDARLIALIGIAWSPQRKQGNYTIAFATDFDHSPSQIVAAEPLADRSRRVRREAASVDATEAG